MDNLNSKCNKITKLANMIFKKSKRDLYVEASKTTILNARFLYDEAKLLIDNDHFARGFALCVLSMEESAKSFLYRCISVYRADEKSTLKFIRVHKNKLYQSSLIFSLSFRVLELLIDVVKIIQKYDKQKIDFPKEFSKESLKSMGNEIMKLKKLDKAKINSIYVDVQGYKVMNPNKLIEKEKALQILELCDAEIDIIKPFTETDDKTFLSLWEEPFASQIKVNELLDMHKFMRNTRNYPVSDIDEGVRRSLKASLEWLESAYMLLRLGKKTQAFIHYTFAVEEFGKAILLNDRKKEALSKGEKTILNDDITFRDHDKKIKKAEETLVDPSTKIRLIDESKIPAFIPDPTEKDDEDTYMEFKDVREFPYKGNFLSFDNRMALMYVDYDEKKKKWKDIEELPFDFSMEVGFDAFKREVQKWQSDFEKSLK